MNAMHSYDDQEPADVREIPASITDRGQVTIPAEVRKLLGLKTKGKVAFVIEDGQVRVEAVKGNWRESFGAVKPRSRPEDFDRMSKDYREEVADRVVGQMRNP